MAVNKVILVGNLGRDPEVRSIPSGQVCNFTLATSDSNTDCDGQRQERADWHNIVVYAACLSKTLSIRGYSLSA